MKPDKLRFRAHEKGILKSVEITSLYHQRDLFIPLSKNFPTVLTGPNGSGKSTILRLLKAAASGDVLNLHATDFQRLALRFTDEKEFIVVRDDTKLVITWNGLEQEFNIPEELRDIPDFALRILQESDYDGDVASEKLSRVASRSGVPFDEYRRARRTLNSIQNLSTEFESELLKDFSNYFAVQFITVGRLSEFLPPEESNIIGRFADSNRSQSAITEASRYIAGYIQDAENGYGRTSQKSDQDLPQHVIEAMKSRESASFEDAQELDVAIKLHSTRLRQLGLLESTRNDTPEFLSTLSESDAPQVFSVVCAILRSSLDRLNTLKEPEAVLSALKQFVDRRLIGKELRLERRKGLTFKTDAGKIISGSKLSSGEQHLIILAFDLLFAASRGSLVLIDEPEISLHINWQDNLLEDLIELGKNKQLSFLMASHAPSIIAPMPECEMPI